MKISLVKQSKLDDPIDEVLDEMKEFGADTPEYRELLSQLERLMELQTKETWTRRIDPTQVAAVTANLVGIAMILNFERLNVVTSKAFGMLLRSKTNP